MVPFCQRRILSVSAIRNCEFIRESLSVVHLCVNMLNVCLEIKQAHCKKVFINITGTNVTTTSLKLYKKIVSSVNILISLSPISDSISG